MNTTVDMLTPKCAVRSRGPPALSLLRYPLGSVQEDGAAPLASLHHLDASTLDSNLWRTCKKFRFEAILGMAMTSPDL